MPELAPKHLGIGVTDAERHQSPDVPEDRLTHRQGKLVDVLVGEREAEPVFAGFGEDGGEGVRAEVLELVDEQMEVAAFRLRDRTARHRGQLELRRQQGTQQVGFVMTQPSFGQVGDEDAGRVHDEGNAHFRPHLPKDVADDRTLQELPELVLDGSDGFALEPWVVALEFVLPEIPDERVLDLAHDPGAVARVRQQPVHPQQGRVLAVQKRRNGVVEDVFEPWPP